MKPLGGIRRRRGERGYEHESVYAENTGGPAECADDRSGARTVFVIAHRLSTVRNANAILVLEQGRVIERGSHADLLEQHGKYYQLYTNMIELA